MTIKELKEKLEEFDENLEVYDSGYEPVEKIYLGIWTHDNYPYNKPDKEILIIY